MPLQPQIAALTLALATLATAALSETLICTGTDPNWQIDLGEDRAQFKYRDRDGDFKLPHTASALNDPETKAYTLIGDTVTAILITYPATCNQDDIAAQVLTQDRSQAILLTGCCRKAPQ